MNTKIVSTCFLAASLMLPVAGYSAERAEQGSVDRSSPKDFVKDSVITTKIKAELAGEKVMSLVRISVDTDAKGMVVLGGTAASQAAVDKAVSIARGVKGVASVRNNIQIKAEK